MWGECRGRKKRSRWWGWGIVDLGDGGVGGWWSWGMGMGLELAMDGCAVSRCGWASKEGVVGWGGGM